ncbi:MAG: hypothetical protein ABI867_13870 [Kofleriaceae bacterium]
MFNKTIPWLLATTLAACTPQQTGMATGDDVADDDDDDVPSGALTVDDTGFFVDGAVRWTANPAPTVTGTVEEANATIEIFAGTQRIAETKARGNTWSIAFPADVLGVIPTDITFSASAASATRKLAVDATPPLTSALPTIVKNEQNDVVTFGANGTIVSHAHVDTGQTTLGDASCPDVFKHAYLMDPGDSNPIHWELRASDDGVGIDPASAMVRVGLRDGSNFGPWRPLTGTVIDGSIDYSIDVTRSGSTGDAFVATTEAPMVVQLAVKDRLDREVSLERCWTNHPLAVPLVVGASAQSVGPLALATNGLEAAAFHNVVAEMINPASKGLSTMDYDVLNGTDETAFVTFTLTRPELRSRRDYVKQSAAKQVVNLSGLNRVNCNDPDSDSRCDAPFHPARVTNIGSTLLESSDHFVVRVLRVQPDGSLGAEVACNPCNDAAAKWTFALDKGHYRVMSGMRDMRSLFPSGAPGDFDDGPFSDFSLGTTAGSFGLSGKTLSSHSGCTHFTTVPIGNTGNSNTFCDQRTDFTQYRALSRYEIAFVTPLTNKPASAPTASIAPRSLGQLAPRALPAFIFDSFETLPQAF